MKKSFINSGKAVVIILVVYIIYVTMAYSLDISFPINIDALYDDAYDWVLAESHSNEGEFTTSAFENNGEVLFRAGEYKTENSNGKYFISHIKHPFRLFHPQIRRNAISLLDNDASSSSQYIEGFWFDYTADYNEPDDQIVVHKVLNLNVWVLLIAIVFGSTRLLYDKYRKKRRSAPPYHSNR